MRSRLLPLVAASLVLSVLSVATPASATIMSVNFTGTASPGTADAAPISGQITFDPGAGTITSNTSEIQYIGPIGGTVAFAGQSFAFPGQGHVDLWDDFPVNHDAFEPSIDRIDVSFFSLDGNDLLHINGAKGANFVQGLSFDQSFDVFGADNSPSSEFAWGHGQPGAIDVEIRLDEVSMHPVPEPGSLLMLVTALGGLMGMGLRSRKSM